jgi:alkylation response protein AidB-like acyl-CoA dehydrogenase
MRAEPLADGSYRLNGAMPWVTAAERSQVLVTGAVLEDGRQILVVLPTDRAGVSIKPAFDLAALVASRTTEVDCQDVVIQADEVIGGPAIDVMAHINAAGTGGLETSALAIGQARAALRGLQAEVLGREELNDSSDSLHTQIEQVWVALRATAEGESDAPSPASVRARANAVALRSTQAYLTARRGRGFLLSDPAQRWARQALFFLVWSCPTPVANAAIRELAGVCTL